MERTSKEKRRNRAGVALAMLLAVSLLASCLSSEDETLGDQPNLSGVWEGTITEITTNNNGTITLTAAHTGNELSGTWAAIFSSPAVVNGGSFTGTLNPESNSGSIL